MLVMVGVVIATMIDKSVEALESAADSTMRLVLRGLSMAKVNPFGAF
jgi:hypothetical protein